MNRILKAELNRDYEVMQWTTLMIKNVPNKFTQKDLLGVINTQFRYQYNYVYLPIDLKTRQSVGFAFINMTHPLFVLDFYLEFNNLKWSDVDPECYSKKMCQIVYANVQGLPEIYSELQGKHIMQKNDKSIKPIFNNNQAREDDLLEVRQRWTKN